MCIRDRDNIAQTKETVKMCRPLNISVEAELGHVGQGVDYSSDGSDHFTTLKKQENLWKKQESIVLL